MVDRSLLEHDIDDHDVLRDDGDKRKDSPVGTPLQAQSRRPETTASQLLMVWCVDGCDGAAMYCCVRCCRVSATAATDAAQLLSVSNRRSPHKINHTPASMALPYSHFTPYPWPPCLASTATLGQMAASTQQQEWRRSPIGITPLSVRPRAGQRRVKKYDVEGAAAAASGADAPPPMAGLQGKKDSSNALKVVVPGRVGNKGEGVTLAAAGAGREGRVCSVCARASADYSCPRCLVGYCSSKCYKVSPIVAAIAVQ